ncbi:MAG: hypothetical protein Q8O31_03300, partial [Rhodocyclaceae bacterium]|nr:hypothetical protein [Rhodocyclaceae bacterium]
MKHAPLTPLPTPHHETCPMDPHPPPNPPLEGEGEMLLPSPFKGEAGRGMGNVFHAKESIMALDRMTKL